MKHNTWNNLKVKHQILQIGLSLLLLFVSNCTCNKLPVQDGNDDIDHRDSLDNSNDNQEKPPVNQGLGGGIANIGNSCYMNATMQLLKAVYPHVFEGKSDPISQAGQKLMEALDEPAGADSATAESFFQALTDKVCGLWKPAGYKTQEDAYDLLRTLFAYFKFPKAQMQTILTNTSISLSIKNPRESNSDLFDILPVPIYKSGKTMQDYFDAEFGKKQTMVDFKWESDDLGPTPGVQLHHVLGLLDTLYENILVVHLLKFEFIKKDNGDFEEKKLEKLTQNPFRLVINKEQRAEKESKAIACELIGFILHSGGTGGGHYEAYAKKDDQWVQYNDSRVSIPSEQDLNSAAEKAYIYFYRPVN